MVQEKIIFDYFSVLKFIKSSLANKPTLQHILYGNYLVNWCKFYQNVQEEFDTIVSGI